LSSLTGQAGLDSKSTAPLRNAGESALCYRAKWVVCDADAGPDSV